MEYKVSEGVYFTDFGKRMNNPNPEKSLKCTFEKDQSNTSVQQLVENLENVYDLDYLYLMLEEFKEKVKSLIDSNSNIIETYDYMNDNDLLDAQSENFSIIQKYFGYIDKIKLKLKEQQSKHGESHEINSELDSLMAQFQKMNVSYKKDDNSMKLEKIDEKKEIEVDNQEEATGISLYI